MVNNEVQHDSENNDPYYQKLGIDEELTVRRLWSIVNADRFPLWSIALWIVGHRMFMPSLSRPYTLYQAPHVRKHDLRLGTDF